MNGATRVAAVCAAGPLIVAALATATRGQGFPKPTLPEGPVEVRVTNSLAVEARQSGPWTVHLDDQARVQIATPSFIEKDGTYEIRWSEIGRWERYRVLEVTTSGWVLAIGGAGESPGRRYLNVARAVSIMRVQ
jgi:hypothetical protein